MSLFQLFEHISSWTSLLLTRSLFQHYIIRWPQVIYWFLKILHLNLLNILILLNLRVVLGDRPTRLPTILTIFNSKISRSILTETRIFLSQLSVEFQNKPSLNLFINVLVMSLSPDKTNDKKRTHGMFPRKSSWIGRTLTYLSLDQGN